MSLSVFPREMASYIGPIFVLLFKWERAEKIKLQKVLFASWLYSPGLCFLSLSSPNRILLGLTKKGGPGEWWEECGAPSSTFLLVTKHWTRWIAQLAKSTVKCSQEDH